MEALFISNGKESVVLARGEFPSEPEKRLEREFKGATRTNYKGYTLIGDGESAVMMIGGSVAAGGQTSALKTDYRYARPEQWASGGLGGADERDSGDGGFSGRFTRGRRSRCRPGASANAGNMVKILNSIQSGAFYLDLRTNISGKATGIVSSDAGAKELHDFRGLLGLGRLMEAKEDVKMQKLFDGLRITLDGRNVNLYIEEQENAIPIADGFSWTFR